MPFLLALLFPVVAAAQAPAFADGLYEEFPSVLMRPVAPLTSAPPTGRYVRVSSRGRRTTVRFLPEDHVRWVIVWGDDGPTSKTTYVDGVVVSTSRFTYAGGRLVAKDVTRPSLPDLHFDYTVDGEGRIASRVGEVPTSYGMAVTEVLTITYSDTGTTETVTHADREVRRDLRDPEGRVLETTFTSAVDAASLVYERAADGALLRVLRVVGGVREAATFDTPRADLARDHLGTVLITPIERHETLLLFGAPPRTTESGRGRTRAIIDHWSGDECWLNEFSEAHYDGTGLLVERTRGCICGLCVDAAAVDPSWDTVLSTHTHWYAGPWVVLDGVWVTPDHEVVTPSGPRPARELLVGDVVADARTGSRVLATVERIEATDARPTVNLETEDGTFVGGGLVFVSEALRSCP